MVFFKGWGFGEAIKKSKIVENGCLEPLFGDSGGVLVVIREVCGYFGGLKLRIFYLE